MQVVWQLLTLNEIASDSQLKYPVARLPDSIPLPFPKLHLDLYYTENSQLMPLQMTNHQFNTPLSDCLFLALCSVVIFKLSSIYLKTEEKYFPYKQGHTYSTTTTFMFYNINSLLQSKYLLTTQLSLRSSSENIHSYVTQPSHMTCSTAIPPQTLCDLPLLPQLQCLGSFLSATRWQD